MRDVRKMLAVIVALVIATSGCIIYYVNSRPTINDTTEDDYNDSLKDSSNDSASNSSGLFVDNKTTASDMQQLISALSYNMSQKRYGAGVSTSKQRDDSSNYYYSCFGNLCLVFDNGSTYIYDSTQSDDTKTSWNLISTELNREALSENDVASTIGNVTTISYWNNITSSDKSEVYDDFIENIASIYPEMSDILKVCGQIEIISLDDMPVCHVYLSNNELWFIRTSTWKLANLSQSYINSISADSYDYANNYVNSAETDEYSNFVKNQTPKFIVE